MKKIFAILMALVLTFAMSAVAFADEPTTTMANSEATSYDAMIKVYTVTGGNTFPAEKLTFTSTPAADNPDTTNITISDLEVTGADQQKLTINVPSYSKVGTYHYTIKENQGNSQGVTYTTESLALSVMVAYDYENNKLVATVGATSSDGSSTGNKNYTLTNKYDLGSLSVTKQVTGNMGDQQKAFDVTVTFKADKTVASAISYTDDGVTKTIATSDWKDGSVSVLITVKHDETVKFTNIPEGITYTVAEDSKYAQGDKNSENGYDAAQYTYSNDNKKIAQNTTDTVTITNNKQSSVDTGITMDSIPYIVLLAVAVVGIAALTMKKRYEA